MSPKLMLTSLCVALAFSGAARAETLDSWKQAVNDRIADAMKHAPDGASGVIAVTLRVAPDGSIESATPVSAHGSGLARGARAVVSNLGTLPPLPGATVPKRVTMLLAFSGSEADNRHQLKALERAVMAAEQHEVAMR